MIDYFGAINLNGWSRFLYAVKEPQNYAKRHFENEKAL
jgi:hypothetical protein